MYRILIVSEDEMLRRMVGYTLADLHVDVSYVSSIEQTEELCRKVLFDLVVVLRTSPFLCGPDLVRRLRPEGARRPEVYVVSWQQTEQTVLSLLEVGVDQYLTFPLSLERLRNKVATAASTLQRAVSQ